MQTTSAISGIPLRRAAVPLMTVRGITKQFPGVRALNGVDLDIHPGEVHALCGENGAGKSTLMQILAGGLRPDAGEVTLRGGVYGPRNPGEARRSGVMLVHQEMSLVPDLSVAENIYLGSLPRHWLGPVDRRRLHSDAHRVLQQAGYAIDPSTPVGALPIARQQMVEIARSTAFPCSLVIFDEPTAALTDAEAESLFQTIEKMRRNGVAIIYISHKMKEVFRLADRISILRDGETQATLAKVDTDEDQVLGLMIGRKLEPRSRAASRIEEEDVLRISGFSAPNAFDCITLTLRKGEILGLYGLVGAGRSELAEALFGLRAATGEVWLDGEILSLRSPKQAVAAGLALVPEDRKAQGLVLSASGLENLILPNLTNLATFGFVSRRGAGDLFRSYAERLGLRLSAANTPVVTLSGGNQQKVVLGKWLATRPKVLILDEPTRGIDVGAKDEFHTLIRELAREGMAVLLISSEMPEVIALSDRVLTMHQGRLTGEFSGDTVREEDLIRAVVVQTARPVPAEGRVKQTNIN